MKSLWKRMSTLRSSILFIVLLCWLLPTVLLGSFMGTRFFTALKEKTELTLMTETQQAQVRVTENLNSAVTLAKDVVYDDELASAVTEFENDSVSYEAYFSRCRSYLERKFGRERLIDFALFFRNKAPSGIFFTSDDYEQALYFEHNVLEDILTLSDSLDTGCAFLSAGENTYLIRNLFNTKMEKYGILVLGLIGPRLFEPVYEVCNALDMGYGIRLDRYEEGNVNYLEQPRGMSEQGELLLFTLDSVQRDYHLIIQLQANRHTVYKDMEAFQRLMIGMFGLLIPIMTALVYFVNKRITRPIALLSEASTKIRGGELGVTVPMHGSDELGQLGSAFSDMSLQLKELVDKSYKEEIALRDAKIQALQSRINSHFLNNALETINWQARMEGSETISEMVEALSCLLNASMDRNERHLVPLNEELKVADAYFYFVGLRFGKRLTVWRDVDSKAEPLMVPRLAIQTLVENAIEHGIAKMGGGRIWLTVYCRENRLHVEVVNNGQRLSQQELERIRRLLDEEGDAQGHMGLRNVARRLRLLFNDKATLSVRQDEKGQTVAAFSIPAITAEEAAQHLDKMRLLELQSGEKQK
ncbi:MAG: sensor histidine kinase [Eubacteriales bacterium]|nr:sensor histidine kinase [Eubacteriales bacterium]